MQAHLNLAGMLYKIKKYEESIQAYSNIIKQNQSSIKDRGSFESAIYGLVLCCIKTKKYQEALKWYE